MGASCGIMDNNYRFFRGKETPPKNWRKKSNEYHTQNAKGNEPDR